MTGKPLTDLPLGKWLRRNRESFEGYSYMRVTAGSILVVDPAGHIGSEFTGSELGHLYELMPEGFTRTF